MNQFSITFDEAIEYRGLKFYPIKVRDFLKFSVFANCLNINKNDVPDVKVISMTNLDYLYYLSETDESKPAVIWFDRLLAMVLKDEKSFEDIEKSILRYGYNDKKRAIFSINGELFTSEDYENIKKIISEQNEFELIDQKISKDVRDNYEKVLEYRNRHSGNIPGSFEDYIISLSIYTGWTLEYIYDMKYRKFINSIKRIDALITYEILTAASMSGFVKFDNKSAIKHWLSHIQKRDRYESAKIGLSEMQGKISQGNVT